MITLTVYQLANLGVVNMREMEIKARPADRYQGRVDESGINPDMIHAAIVSSLHYLYKDGHAKTDAYQILYKFVTNSECEVYWP